MGTCETTFDNHQQRRVRCSLERVGLASYPFQLEQRAEGGWRVRVSFSDALQLEAGVREHIPPSRWWWRTRGYAGRDLKRAAARVRVCLQMDRALKQIEEVVLSSEDRLELSQVAIRRLNELWWQWATVSAPPHRDAHFSS